MRILIPGLVVSSLTCALAFGCQEGDADAPVSAAETGGQGGAPSGQGGDDSSATGGGDASGGTASGGSASELAEPNCPPTADLGVRIVGRHDGCTEGAIRQAWPGTGFVARFEGTGLSFTQDGRSVQYTVVVDGEVQEEVQTESGEVTTVVATGLADGEHVVEVYRQDEASFGTTTLLSVEVEDGELLDPPPVPERFIEIYGDSVTAGYGNEGADTSCGFSADTQNHYLTYGAFMARALDADLSTVAWSGKGVVFNYGGDTSTTLPEMAERAIPAESSSVWDYSVLPEPDAVVLNLSTNDFSTDNDPEHEEFVTEYVALLESIRARYPDAFILCTVGPLLNGADLQKARDGILAAVTERIDAGDAGVAAHEMTTGNPSPGCDWHPSVATHQAMAEELTPVLADELGW